MAEPVGKIDERNGGVGQFEPSAELRTRGITGHCHGERGRAIAHKVRIETLKQPQVESSFGAQVERVIADQLHPALNGDVRLIPHQMEFFHLQGLIFDGQMNRAIILHLDIFDVGGELADVAGNHEAARPFHKPANVNGPGDGGVAGDLALKVSADQRIKVETGEFYVNLAGPVPAKPDISIHV